MPYRAHIWGDIRTVRVIPVDIRIWAVTPVDIPMVPGILRACRRGIRRALRAAG